jgi:peptidyl-prolyl cis-trans isomerase A (cyclophilin A)
MILTRRTAFTFAAASLFSFAAFAQQPAAQTPPTPAPTSTPAPSTASQDLPDAPGTQGNLPPQPTGPTAVLDTSLGRITCKLFDKQAPETVANFIGLAQGTKEWTDPVTKEKMHGKPFYDGTIFHRVIPDFMVQGGDRTGTGMGDPGYLFKDELSPDLNFDVPGRLAMANSGPDTNGSQFFVTTAATEWLNQKHTIFGQCDEHGLLVAQSIAEVSRDSNDKPTDPVILKKVTIVPEGQPVPPLPASSASAPPSSAAPTSAPQP